MEAFLTAILSFPTIVFTIALGFVLLYSSLVIFGALDLDTLDSVFGIDAAEGVLDGAIDSIGADATIEGLDAIDDLGEVGMAKGGVLTGIMNVLGIRGVPVTIVAMLLVLFAWAYSFLIMYFGGSWIGAGFAGILVKGIIGLTAFGLGTATASALVRPIRGVFVTSRAPARSTLVGKFCTIQSLTVTAGSGRAEIADGGAGFIAEVRCTKENDLTRGSTALVFDYDRKQGIYHVAPVDETLAKTEQILSS